MTDIKALIGRLDAASNETWGAMQDAITVIREQQDEIERLRGLLRQRGLWQLDEIAARMGDFSEDELQAALDGPSTGSSFKTSTGPDKPLTEMDN